jgi:hypothetical protein
MVSFTTEPSFGTREAEGIRKGGDRARVLFLLLTFFTLSHLALLTGPQI